jgi:hypothetical protein
MDFYQATVWPSQPERATAKTYGSFSAGNKAFVTTISSMYPSASKSGQR